MESQGRASISVNDPHSVFPRAVTRPIGVRPFAAPDYPSLRLSSKSVSAVFALAAAPAVRRSHPAWMGRLPLRRRTDRTFNQDRPQREVLPLSTLADGKARSAQHDSCRRLMPRQLAPGREGQPVQSRGLLPIFVCASTSPFQMARET